MQNNFGNLGNILNQVLQSRGLKGKALIGEILFEYDQLLHERLNEKSIAKARKLQDKILYVAVKDSAWAQKINFLNPEILEILQEKYPHKIVKISLQLGEL